MVPGLSQMCCSYNRWSTWLIFSRWWGQYKIIPWPDSCCLFISTCIQGHDERCAGTIPEKSSKEIWFSGVVWWGGQLLGTWSLPSFNAWEWPAYRYIREGEVHKDKLLGWNYWICQFQNNLTKCLRAAVDVLLSCAMASTQCRFFTMQFFWFFHVFHSRLF